MTFNVVSFLQFLLSWQLAASHWILLLLQANQVDIIALFEIKMPVYLPDDESLIENVQINQFIEPVCFLQISGPPIDSIFRVMKDRGLSVDVRLRVHQQHRQQPQQQMDIVDSKEDKKADAPRGQSLNVQEFGHVPQSTTRGPARTELHRSAIFYCSMPDSRVGLPAARTSCVFFHILSFV